jgi:hypothetical protein
VLTRLADLSGGRTFSIGRINELDEALDVIREELENQYLIGYTPRNATRDGSYRQIRVVPSQQRHTGACAAGLPRRSAQVITGAR